MKKALFKKLGDNVATVLDNVKKGEVIQVVYSGREVIEEIVAVDDIPFGNKISVSSISPEEFILKGGYKIGICTKELEKGKFVHVHNVRSQVVDFPESIIDEIKRQMNITE